MFWTGAGVSMDAPSSMPSGAALTERVAEQLFLPGLLDDVAGYYRDLEIKDQWGGPRRLPRLEFLLGIGAATHGDRAFEVLSDIEHVQPNWLHHFYAEHCAAGGRHATANFDLAIERAGAPVAGPIRLIHFHGSLAAGGYAHLGTTLARIQHGLEPDVERNLLTALRDSKWLVVAGYSGSDFFDIDPFMEQVAARIGPIGVLWINHAGAWGTAERVVTDHPLPMARSLARAGLEVWWLDAPTREVHELLGKDVVTVAV